MDTEIFKNLIPRPLDKRDLSLLVTWANSNEFSRVPYIGTPGTPKEADDWFCRISKSVNREDFAFERDGNVRAFGGLTDIDLKEKTASIYIFVYPSLMNLWVGTGVIEYLCSHGFEKLMLDRIFPCINSNDLATQRTYEGYGFHEESFGLIEYAVGIYSPRPRYRHTLSRTDWERLKTSQR